ncbi:MAG: exosortase H-associated membrane protein [Thermodesulfovibrionales bacterium]
MQGNDRQKQTKGAVLRVVVVFIVSYLIFLAFWIAVKDYYGSGVTFMASKVAAGVKDLKFEEITREPDVIQATFSPRGRGSKILIDIPVKTSSYTFNAPLTLAIMTALYPFIRKRKQAYAQALLILLAVHILYVFSLEAKEATDVLVDKGLEKAGTVSGVLYQFLWSFTDNMVIRFEPFLIGLYMYVRFRQ